MKRSEMVSKLTHIIWNAQGQFGEPNEYVADEVLKEIEKLGMLPPTTYRVEIGVNKYFPLNKWEEEEE